MPKKVKTKGSATKKSRGLSRLRKPEEMSLEDWQVTLRREFAQSQKFRVKNLGDRPPTRPGRVAHRTGCPR